VNISLSDTVTQQYIHSRIPMLKYNTRYLVSDMEMFKYTSDN